MAELHEELIAKLIARPNVPQHFMRLLRPAYRVSASLRSGQLATSTETIEVIEVGKDIYEPTFYFPRPDVEMSMLRLVDGKSTHCPLKGDTQYFDLRDGDDFCQSGAWSYHRPLDFAAELKDFIAFDASMVKVERHRTSWE